MRTVLADNDFIRVGRVAAPVRAESCHVEGAGCWMFDVAERAVGSKWAEAAAVVLTCWSPEFARWRDVQICAILALRAQPILAELFALPLIPQIERMRELARVTFLTEPSLVMFADEMPYARAVFFGNVVSIWA